MKQIMLLLAFVAIGCKPRIVYVDRPVEVRVAVPVPCPEPPVFKRPEIKPLPPNATKEQIAEEALRSMLLVMGYANQLEVALDAYRHPVKK